MNEERESEQIACDLFNPKEEGAGLFSSTPNEPLPSLPPPSPFFPPKP